MSETTEKDSQLEPQRAVEVAPVKLDAAQQDVADTSAKLRLATDHALQPGPHEAATLAMHPDCARLDSLISKLDKHFTRFENLMTQFIDGSGLPKELKTRLKQPFVTYNKYRNLGQARNRTRMGAPKGDFEMFGGDKLFFNFKETNDVGYAAFNNHGRTIELRRDFDPNSNFDLFALYHELVHVNQDDIARPNHFDGISTKDLEAFDLSIARETLPSEEHRSVEDNLRIAVAKRVASYQGSENNPSTKIMKEAEAYGLQLELLDIISEKQLRGTSRPLGIKNPKKKRFMQEIIDTTQHNELASKTIGNLEYLAVSFFPIGLQGNYHAAYLKKLEKFIAIADAQ